MYLIRKDNAPAVATNVPEVADLNVQLRHAGVDLLARCGLAVQEERSALRVRVELTADDEIGLALRAFKLDLNMPVGLVILDE